PFPLRPGPDPRFTSTKPLLADPTALPTPEEIDALRKLGKTDPDAAPGAAAPLWDVIMVQGQRIEGTVIRQDDDGTVTFQMKNSTVKRIFKKGQYTEVILAQTPEKWFQSELERLKGADAKAYEVLSEDCVKRKMFDEAARALEIALSMQFKMPTLGKLGDLYATGLADPDREVRLYRTILEKSPIGADVVWTRLGRVYEALGLPTRAIEAYSAGTKAAQFAPEPRQRLAILFAADGRFAEAQEHLDRMNAAPQNLALPDSHLAAGTLAWYQGRLEPAKEELAQAGPAGLHLLGCAEAHLGSTAAAVAAFKAALAADPERMDAWLNLGVICGLAGDWTRARACFEEAAYRAPVSPHPWAALGWASLREAKAQEAAAAYDEALRRDPRCAQALLGKGRLALDAGDFASAETNLLAALKAGAGAVGFRELGLARLRLRNTSGAVEALRRAVEFSADPDAHALLGFAILATNADAGEEQFRRGIEADPDHILSNCGLAAVDYARRDLNGAKNRFDVVLSRVPDHAFAMRGKRLANEAATRTLREEYFERKDAEALKHQWVEREKEGLKIVLQRGRAVFMGRQVRDDGVTTMYWLTTDKFLSFEAELDCSKIARATAGLTVAVSSADAKNSPVIRLVRTIKGRIGFWQGQAGQPPVWQDGGDAPEGTLRLRIERTGASGGAEWGIWVNGTRVGLLRADLRGKTLEAGIYGAALKDESWELAVDNVRLIEAK
ncbi:MAG: tetratricopeptide repeat protein, partial [Planctomycetes bacterium]|nr:tetratricopeptide repeat protein [Planctomycetota bacterium]